MTIRKNSLLSSFKQKIKSNQSSGGAKSNRREKSRRALRQRLIETLESRQLLTVGPQLVGIQPNNSDLLFDGDVRTIAPRELSFRFDDAQAIDPTTLDGIRITASGRDGTFGLASGSSDLSTNGAVDLQFTSQEPGVSLTVNFNVANLGIGGQPVFAVNGDTVDITLNNLNSDLTTAQQLVDAAEASPELEDVLTIAINGGDVNAELTSAGLTSLPSLTIGDPNDEIIEPGSIEVGTGPNQNEVTFRFASELPDDVYRVDIFGFDDPNQGVVGLRALNTRTGESNFFSPTIDGTRQDTLEFRLDLGSRVTGVVPQPVFRVDGELQQARDTIIVHFDDDKLLVENDENGNPTARSVENPEFYQLILTQNTVRNTDDVFFSPALVTYNASVNTATLRFDRDINLLAGSNAESSAFRLRIGNRESQPIAPTTFEATATAFSDLGSDGAANVRFASRLVGEVTDPISVSVINSGSGDDPIVTGVNNNVITLDLGRDDATVQEAVDALNASSLSGVLVDVELLPGSDGSAIIGDVPRPFSPIELQGLGSSFDTATDLGTVSDGLTSLLISSSIDAEDFELDLPGSSLDPGHRTLTQNSGLLFEDHINADFGADDDAGITTIFYNFQNGFSTDVAGNTLTNAITEAQKTAVRQALGLWADNIGVQFIETADLGITFATGSLTGLSPRPGTEIRNPDLDRGIPSGTNPQALNFGVRIDTSFEESLVLLSASNDWNADFGEDYFRTVSAGIGFVLGLEYAGDLPSSTLARLDPEFLAGSGVLIDANDAQLNASEERFEPIVPGNQDIVHGQFLYREDGQDIDLYRFEVDFGDDDSVGLFTAETFSQRLLNSSQLNTNLELFRETLASETTSFGIGDTLSVEFTAVRPGEQGNNLQLFFTQSDRGTPEPGLNVFPNAISIDLSTTPGSETRVIDVINALNLNPAASRLVSAEIAFGDELTVIGSNTLTQNPVVLSGGNIELISQNDDYFNNDSFIRQSLTSGVYYLGVSASGNDEYNGNIEGTGFGGNSQGDYELRVTYRAAVDTSDAIQDVAGSFLGDPSVGFDGDADGIPGGVHNFWFETRGLNRVLNLTAGSSPQLEGETIRLVGANGATRTFEFSTDGIVTPGNIRIANTPGLNQGQLADAIASAINSQGQLNITAFANGAQIELVGERILDISESLTIIDVNGKTIFVDKAAGTNADGTLNNPFNNISRPGVPNAFEAVLPGDIVRIVGNGGGDGLLETVDDNFAYEIGFGLLPGSVLDDGTTLEVPQGVTAVVDPGAIFKLNRARIAVGSTNLGIDRSGAALQILGAPTLVDQNGNALRDAEGNPAPGSVFFTSWLDETLGRDTHNPTTTPSPGDWGGILFRRDLDVAAGRTDLEDEGIFINYVNHADIRFGGGSVVADSIQQSFSPIDLIDTRPTISFSSISDAANAAISAGPNSFEETNFHEPRFQANGLFTSDYDRVGPDFHGNRFSNNSVNGLFISVETAADSATRTLSVPGRFDDTDIVHVLTENLVLDGSDGSSLLDTTSPDVSFTALEPTIGGTLLPGTYTYKLTLVDSNGYESVPSNATSSVTLIGGQTAVDLANLPSVTGDFVSRKLYRSAGNGQGPFTLVANLDGATSDFLDLGQDLNGTLTRDRLDSSNVVVTTIPGGSIAPGTYNYRIVEIDSAGREDLASEATASVILSVSGSIELTGLPLISNSSGGRRIYRSTADGSGPFTLVGELSNPADATVTSFIDDGSTAGPTLSPSSLGITRPRLGASLVVDPGSIIKLESARIEASFGSNLIIEGTDDLPIVFTSRLDDRFGAGGTFDTNNNGDATQASPRDWGGIYVGPTSQLSLDYARVSFAGGVTTLESTFRAFNPIELHQATGRIANTIFEDNADGFGGQGPGARFGRLSNSPATIFVRGAQPIIIDNTFVGNAGSVIDIDANSLNEDIQGDRGRQSGAADVDPSFSANRGPLIRNNRLANNELNGLEIRGDFLTTESVYDDTDIVHVIFDEIFVGNLQHDGGLRLQSSPRESLVVKFEGAGSNFNRNLGAGLTARGDLQSTVGNDRVGGTIHVLGQPGFPVILTSLRDDTVGAGLRPDGTPQTDTNNDGFGSRPAAGDFRGILLDQLSNDRNVAKVLETEDFTAAAPGPNGSTFTAQALGDLAAGLQNGNENLRLGFSVQGVLSQNEDVDVYSFSGVAGTEVFIDVDDTTNNVDLVLEVLDASGVLLARSDNSTAESVDPSLLVTGSGISPDAVNPLSSNGPSARINSSGLVHEPGTTNPLDPGLRIVLPGAPGQRSDFFFRIRSNSLDPNAVNAGLTSGSYEVQVRLREEQEFAGSTVDFADIRYATNGVLLRGLPGESPLLGEAGEDEAVAENSSDIVFSSNNDVAVGNPIDGNRPQYVGNLLDTGRGAISIAGTLSAPNDVDFFYFDVSQEDVLNNGIAGSGAVPFSLDVDYADGLNRPDTNLYVFREETSFRFGLQYRLLYSGSDSNIADDQRRPLTLTDVADLTRGSVGQGDSFIGPAALTPGNYLIAVTSRAVTPRALTDTPNVNVRPINSVRRIVDEGFAITEQTAEAPVIENFLPTQTASAGNDIVSTTFDLGDYSAGDLPRLYVDYFHAGGQFEIAIQRASGDEVVIGSTNVPGQLTAGVANFTADLDQFAGEDNLTLIVRSSNNTVINDLVIGFAERGEQYLSTNEDILLANDLLLVRNGGPADSTLTRPFSLATYTIFDQPQVTFDYDITDGQLDVFAVVNGVIQQRLATSVAGDALPGEPVLQVGAPASQTVNLTGFAGQTGIQILFQTRTDDPSTTFIQNVRGELLNGARFAAGEPNSTFALQNVDNTVITTGDYQVELRIGDEFFGQNTFGQPVLTRSFDTNDRLANSISIVAPAGNVLTDGDSFAISDGATRVVFEFTTDGNIGLGNIPIRFLSSDSDFVIARQIRDAINNPNVQSRLNVSSATSSGLESGATGTDNTLNLFGDVNIELLVTNDLAGELEIITNVGNSDSNIQRAQGQVLIQNSFIRNSRDYGIFSQPAGRLQDPRDADLGTFEGGIQNRPNLGASLAGAVRNLPILNNSVDGGLLPGVVIQNNVLEEGGLGGINISGETPIFQISPTFIPALDNTTDGTTGSHFGSFIDDGDFLSVDSDRTRLLFEFEDIAGAAAGGPDFGSGVVQGNGVSADAVPVYYREDAGVSYLRGTPPFGYSALETILSLRDSFLGSAFVTNGTTQQVVATAAASLLGAFPGAPPNNTVVPLPLQFPNYFNRPALFLEGVTDVQYIDVSGVPDPFIIETIPLAQAPQPQSRLVNNTIIGSDGRASFNGDAAADESNDLLSEAVQTFQGISQNPQSYTATGAIGDNAALSGGVGTDVDIYQFRLDVGERVRIDIDSPNSDVDTLLQVFDSNGVAQTFLDSNGNSLTLSDADLSEEERGNPGLVDAADPFIDFVATTPGVYYAAVSGLGNDSFDPLSFANRVDSDSLGEYEISINVSHPQQFTIVAEDAVNYQQGDTFTIHQVSNVPGTNSTGRTFEFTFTGGVSDPNNIPIQLAPTWFFPDVARAIARAINLGDGGQPVLRNEQNLPNGDFGLANPIPPVRAVALGGLDGVIEADFNGLTGDIAELLDAIEDPGELGENALSQRELERRAGGPIRSFNPGLELFPRRNDGVGPTHSSFGLGHDRGLTTPLSPTSQGDGTTEKFVVVNNAAFIEGNGNLIVDPDVTDNHSLDQLLPETGILATRGASPTILNNVFFNLQTAVINEESRRFPLTNAPAPFGSNNENGVTKPGEVVLGGSVFQFSEPAVADIRFGTGIENTPTNIPNVGLDFNIVADADVQLFTNPLNSEFLPAAQSIIIDSSIDSLPERPALADVKEAVGITVSPILAPEFDAVGQLRRDDPDVTPPNGQGENIFRDRGALDRSDFIGPAASLLDPIDNDSIGVDRDGSVSFVELTSGVLSEFRIQLADGNEPTNPFIGIGIDDNSVENSEIGDLRLTGAAVVVFEDGRLLEEGVDYTFAYNSTRDEIILTPLAGVWESNRVYEISLNNTDRFVLSAPTGESITDGDLVEITDANGDTNFFEFDSGFRLQLPQGLEINVPLAGASAGGVADGDRIEINDGVATFVFELDTNDNVLLGNIAVPISLADNQDDITEAILTAIVASGVNVNPTNLGDGRLFIGTATGTTINTTQGVFTQPTTTLGLEVPEAGALPGGILDGQLFAINDGLQARTFEFDSDGNVLAGNIRVDISAASTANDVLQAMIVALQSSGLSLTPAAVNERTVRLGLPSSGSVTTATSELELVGAAQTISDGDTVEISRNGVPTTFEFDSDGNATGDIVIPFDVTETQDAIGNRFADAITGSGVELNAIHFQDGNIALGGDERHAVSVASAESVSLIGEPGVQPSTTLTLNPTTQIVVPSLGGISLTDNSSFTVQGPAGTATFEFDSDFSGPTGFGNTIIQFTPSNTADDIALNIAGAISTSGIGINARSIGGGRIELGLLPGNAVNTGNTNLFTQAGTVTDGDTFSISNGVTTVEFEFNNDDLGNGSTPGRTSILFSDNSTIADILATMMAAIEDANLNLQTVIEGNSLRLLDSPSFTTDASTAASITQSGLPGGAKAVRFVQDTLFDGTQIAESLVAAINDSDTILSASIRGGNTLFVENALSINSDLPSFFLRAIQDLAGNDLRPNRVTNDTRFTILTPGTQLDFGDAPDPFTTTAGRFATQLANDGARHVITQNGPRLITPGATVDTITAESDGLPTPEATGDSGDDGVTFTSETNPLGIFNRNINTDITISVNQRSRVDAWIDFNADGDWDDPGEQILVSEEFGIGSLTRVFTITIPEIAPEITEETLTFARFRVSSEGGLLPSGLAVDGEVEDYAVTLVPGTPPTAIDDVFNVNEDASPGIVTSDADGSDSPGFSSDDGVAANDTDPEGGPLSVILVDGPTNGVLNLNEADGTFTYTPNPEFFGTDTLTYQTFDGVLTSTNFGTVTINVNPVNDAPIPGVHDVQLAEDEEYVISVADLVSIDSPGPANESGQSLTITQFDTVSSEGGSISITNGVLTYSAPFQDFTGTDTFTYTITDNGTTNGVINPLSAIVTVTLNVLDTNDAPIPGDDFVESEEGQTVSIPSATVLGNDSPGPANESDQTLALTGVEPNSFNGGTVAIQPNGTITYTPAPNFSGIDQVFYSVTDDGTSNGVADPRTSRGTIFIDVGGVNDVPFVSSPIGTISADEDATIASIDLQNVFDDFDILFGGDVLTYSVSSISNTGLVNANVNGSILNLDLLPDQNGTGQVIVQATDAAGESVTDTITLNINSVADNPRLLGSIPNQNFPEDSTPGPVNIVPTFIFDPDVDTDGDTVTLIVTGNSNPNLVNVTVSGGDLLFSFAEEQIGTATITVTASDAAGNSITDTFDVTVDQVNDPPVPSGESYTVPEGGTLVANDVLGTLNDDPNDNGVLVNDTDIEGNPITAELVSDVRNGILTFNSNGTFTYIPDGTAGTTDSFSYRPVDALGAAGNAVEVFIDITEPLPPPHQNPINRFDVDANGVVTPRDVLLVINFINRNGSTSVEGLPSPPPFRDVDGNGFIQPLDALLVINELNRNGIGGGEGEGEGEFFSGIVDSGISQDESSSGIVSSSNFAAADNTAFNQSYEMVSVYGPQQLRPQAGPVRSLSEAISLGQLLTDIADEDSAAADQIGNDLSERDLESETDLALAALFATEEL